MTTDDNVREISASQLASQLGAVLTEVAGGASFLITRNGKAVGVLEPAGSYHGADQSLVAEEQRVEYAAPAPSGQRPETALARLIGAPSTRAVLALFLTDPARRQHQREIARRAGLGLRSAQIALDKLEALGLVASEHDGNRRYYHAVRSERFVQLQTLLGRELGLVEVLARHLAVLGSQVCWAFVFGSLATGDDTVESDIDLLVVGDVTEDRLVAPLADARRELGREIDLVTYRRTEFAQRKAEGAHFITSLLSQPRIDVVGGPGAC